MALFAKKNDDSRGLWTGLAVGAVGAAALVWFRRRRKSKREAASATNGSQRLAVNEFRSRHRRRNRRALKVLMVWAAANMAAGAVGRQSSTGWRRDFHEMNLAWNGVNAVIALAGYKRWSDPDDSQLYDDGANRAVYEATGTERLLAINCGLDVLYITAGTLMWQRGTRSDSPRLQGYGPSVILQGAFLLGFDTIWLAATRRHRRRFEDKIEPPMWKGRIEEERAAGWPS